jgi:hypothetical protein
MLKRLKLLVNHLTQILSLYANDLKREIGMQKSKSGIAKPLKLIIFKVFGYSLSL